MPWWGWIIIGALLLGSELMLVDAAFYLVFIGLAAIITGVVGKLGIDLEIWAQWILFASLSLVTMILFREKLYKKFHAGRGAGYEAGPAGEIIKLQQGLSPGESCRMPYRGTTWTILNNGSEAINNNENVRIRSVDGLTLNVEKMQINSEEKG